MAQEGKGSEGIARKAKGGSVRRYARAGLWVALFAALLWTASCREESASDESAPPQSSAVTHGGIPADLKEGGRAEIIAELERQRGKVVLLDFWATWCPPCVEDFPRLVAWHEKYGPQGLAVVSVSVDTLDNRQAVAEFLKRQGATFPAFILDAPNYDDFVTAFDSDWSGAVPALFIYDRAGERRHLLEGEQPAEEIEGTFVPLLGEDDASG